MLNTLVEKNKHHHKFHLKCECLDGAIFNGGWKPIIYNFALDRHPGFEFFCNPGTFVWKQMNLYLLV